MKSTLIKRLPALLVAAFAIAFASPARAVVSVGDKPELAFTAADGTDVDLSRLRGKIVVVDFWATWCEPCMAEADHMVKVNKDNAAKGVVFIGISLDTDKNKMMEVARDKGFDWPQYFDGLQWNNKVFKLWGDNGIPLTLIISPEGQVLWRGHPTGIDGPLADALKLHPPQLVEAKVLAAATALLDKADGAIKANNPAAAAKLAAQVPPDAQLDTKFAARFTALQGQLNDYGKTAMDLVGALIEKKDFAAAGEKLSELVAAFGATPIGKEAKAKLAELNKNPDARAAIEAQAREAKAKGLLDAVKGMKQGEPAYAKLKLIVKEYAGTAAAKSAAEMVAEYEKDPDFVHKANQDAVAAKANSLLSIAGSYAASGLKEQARKKYQQVIDEFPDSTFAQTAAQKIAALK